MAGPSQKAVLLRHGETEWSLSGRHTGRTDVPLTERGRGMAERAGRAIRAFHVVAVMVSPLLRARDTARLAGLWPATIVDDLAEWDYGDYEGLTTDEIRTLRPGWNIWVDGCPGGEDIASVGARADRAIAAARAVQGDVALVAHGHILRILAARWLEQPPLAGRRLVLDTATISVLGYERENAAVLRWNDDCHLRATAAATG